MNGPIFGSFLGTGALITIDGERLGFKPKKIVLQDITNGLKLEWQVGMGDAHGIKTAANGDRTRITSAGITPTNDGFTLGTDAFNASAATILYEVVG